MFPPSCMNDAVTATSLFRASTRLQLCRSYCERTLQDAPGACQNLDVFSCQNKHEQKLREGPAGARMFYGSVVTLVLVLVGPVFCQSTLGHPVQDMIQRNNDFASKLFRALAARTDENLLLCPIPLFSGLSALMSASPGPAQEQMLQALGLTGLEPHTVPDLFQSLSATMLPADRPAALKQGMAVFPAVDVNIPDSVADLVRSKYGGTLQNFPSTSPDEAVDTINRWAQGHVGDQVQMLDTLKNSDSQLLLVTAASYQTSFSPAFNSSLTLDERFYVDKYHVTSVPMMLAAGKFFLAYDRTLRVGVLQLQMTDGSAMLVLLPDEGVDVTSVEEEVTSEKIQSWTRALKKTKLEVQLPRLLLQQSYSLRQTLKTFGITRLFPEENDIVATKVLSAAVLSADERSQVAPVFVNFQTPPPRLTVNRPFVFIVYEQNTAGVLLMGRVVDPTQK